MSKQSNHPISDIKNLESEQKVSKTTRQLEDLLKAREIQKNKLEQLSKQKEILFKEKPSINTNPESIPVIKKPQTKELDIPPEDEHDENATRIVYLNKPKNYIPECQHDPYTITQQFCPPIPNCDHTYIWDAYWPFIGSGDQDPRLDVELDYITFNGVLIEKWHTSLPTPITTVFPIKDIFKFNLQSGMGYFDFDLRLENIPASGNPTVLNINPKSTTMPFNINQFILIKDPNVSVTTPGTSPTDILAVMGYYHSNELYLNQFTQATDSFETNKNIFLSTQLMFIHVSQIKDDIKLSITHNTGIGENLFKVKIETKQKLEIKEVLIPVNINPLTSGDEIMEINISVKTIYINGKYFMTYATYVNDVATAQHLVDNGYINDTRQTPIQLGTMLLFGEVAPIVNLDTVVGTSDHERVLIKLYREVLKKNP